MKCFIYCIFLVAETEQQHLVAVSHHRHSKNETEFFFNKGNWKEAKKHIQSVIGDDEEEESANRQVHRCGW